MRHSIFKMDPRFRWAAIAVAAIVAVASTSGCAASADEDAQGAPRSRADDPDKRFQRAQAKLAEHDVEEARYLYDQIISETPHPPGRAYAGKALTDLLLLPGAQTVSTLLVDHLGATSGIDANDLIYATEGILYWQVRGVPWSDGGDYADMRTLIADELPWSRQQTSSARAFYGGLDQPVNLAMDDLVKLADSLSAIEANLGRAVDDPEFEAFYVPGQTFYSDDLNLVVGPVEVHLLRGALAAVRGAIYFAAAYEYDWTLDGAFGSQEGIRQTPHAGWSASDYTTAYLNPKIGRQIREAARLQRAQAAFDTSLTSVIAALDVGASHSTDSTLQWGRASDGYAAELVDFLSAIRDALYGPAVLPGSTPETTMDLSSFFAGDRTLDPDLNWYNRVDDRGEPDGLPHMYWEVSDQAFHDVFVQGVFNPGFQPDDNGPTFDIGDERSSDFFESLGGGIGKDVQNAYFSTR